MGNRASGGAEAFIQRGVPVFERPRTAQFDLGGVLGERLRVCVEHWWLTAPDANPAMLQMFRDRDRKPYRGLLPWSGEFVGKYLTSAVLGWRLTRDERLSALIARVVRELAEVQGSDGYLGPFPREKRLTGRFARDDYSTLAGGEYALWDLWGHYHCILGLLLWYEQSHDERALQVCCRAADLLCDTFLNGSIRVHDAGAEEMNMAISHGLCLLYEHTGYERYLALAREVEADWQKPPAGDYLRCALEGIPFFQMPKPRWESLHDIQALAELFVITGDERYRSAIVHIWRSIVETDRHNTGGFSSGEQATGDPYDQRAIETCCTVAWIALSVDVLRLTGDPYVADEIELATYNGLVGGQAPSGRWWTYNTPMDGVKKASAHDIVFQARPGSPELNCCSVNGPRGLGLLAEWSVMLAADGVVVNFYGPGEYTLDLATDVRVQLRQETAYPIDGHVRLRVGLPRDVQFVLRLRIPSWSKRTIARLNGEEISDVVAGRYLEIGRVWCDGDVVELTLDMSPHFWFGERAVDGKASIYRGPILLAYDQRYNDVDPDELPVLSTRSVAFTREKWEGPLPPWLLLSVRTSDGGTLRLCDFANAGATGTHYRSWLPVDERLAPIASGGLPIWATRLPEG